ncbi:TolC family outer membrane protein [Sphingomonas sp. BT-65]|uniref:TolC family outer membrane protein n=1 Tax=Sphingomonas sp. BT-65 TaxID=2989821 RepID=UPI002235B48E|nr:TolC family outer membrane protein [Sphingomonas sp. BT-65]MCW4461057.1 TolC family outer membrane protein [Sphingomonas sp. BT-65]
MRLSHFLAGVSAVGLAIPAAAQTTPPPAAQAPAAAPTETLREAMVKAYNTNPDLSGERANLRADDEEVPIARSRGLPGVNSTAAYNENLYDSDDSGVSAPRTGTVGVNLNVPVYSGGAVRNSVRAAKTRVEAGRAGLRSVEAQLFTDVVSAYMDVTRDEAIVRLNQQNVRVLEVNLQATQDRFEVGDLTRTDVAQSEARLALAQSQLRGAEASLIGSRENYIRVIGTPPGTLAPPPPLPNLPAGPDQAVSVALEENPALDAAEKARDASAYDVRVARAGRLPQVSVGVGGDYYNRFGSVGRAGQLAGLANDGFATTAGVNLSLPLFQGGRPAAQVRQAQARQSAAIEQVTSTERGVIAQTRSAYAVWQSALRVIESSKLAVSANRLSLEGVRAENSVGTRTILDILNAEQELLNSQVQLVTAERDAYVAGFAVLASMGRAEAQDLGLDGGPLYDPVANYDRVRNSLSDWRDGPAPEPQATRTTDTPAQTPVVSGPIDPVEPR